MWRFVLIVLLGTLLFGGLAAQAPAQRDAGAKARGEFGKGFWDERPAYRRSFEGPSFYRPTPRVEGYRSFSYEPVVIVPGDTVVIRAENARLMMGRAEVGTLAMGQEFKVTRVINGWLGAVVEKDGQELKGWVWHRNVVLDRADERAPATAGRADTPRREYRRFSFEPSDNVRYAPPAVLQPAQRRPTPPEVRLRPGTRAY